MNATSFLLAHGEKLLVLAVAGGCAYALAGSLHDPEFRPKDSSKKIDELNAAVEKKLLSADQLNLKAPRSYANDLLARLAEAPPVSPVMPWLTVPPDVRKGPTSNGPYFYVYQLPQPEVTLKDAIGQLEITIRLPAQDRLGPARRSSAEPDKSWVRQDKGGAVTNTAHLLGVGLELSIGEGGAFKPLILKGSSKDGILPMSMVGMPLRYLTSEPWQKHFVRARLVAAATAYDAKVPDPRPKNTVLVMPGPAVGDLAAEQTLLGQLADEAAKGGGPHYDLALKPESGLALPEGATVAANEKVFRHPQQDRDAVPMVTVTDSIRFALLGIGSELKDGGPPRDVARFVFLKRFTVGAEVKWMDKPIELKYGEGDKLGEKVDVQFGEKKIPADLSTPFVITKIAKGQPRIIYWFIKPKTRASGGKDRDLELDKKEMQTDIVSLKNPASGREMVVHKLSRINPPSGSVVFYPNRSGQVDEREEFVKAPSEFLQYDLRPAEPKAFPPGSGPLDDLRQEKVAAGAVDAGIYDTDTDYYQMPDGRLVWWDKTNHTLAKYDPHPVETQAVVAPMDPGPAPTQPVPPTVPKPPTIKPPPGAFGPGGPNGMPPMPPMPPRK